MFSSSQVSSMQTSSRPTRLSQCSNASLSPMYEYLCPQVMNKYCYCNYSAGLKARTGLRGGVHTLSMTSEYNIRIQQCLPRLSSARDRSRGPELNAQRSVLSAHQRASHRSHPPHLHHESISRTYLLPPEYRDDSIHLQFQSHIRKGPQGI